MFGDIPTREPVDKDTFLAKIDAMRKETKERRLAGVIDPAKSGDAGSCTVDHFKHGFEGHAVYVWRGPFKGKLGVVTRMSGRLARVSFDSAIRGTSILDIPTECLVA